MNQEVFVDDGTIVRVCRLIPNKEGERKMLKVRTDDGTKKVVGCIITYPRGEQHHWCGVCKLSCKVKNIPPPDANSGWKLIDLDRLEDAGCI